MKRALLAITIVFALTATANAERPRVLRKVVPVRTALRVATLPVRLLKAQPVRKIVSNVKARRLARRTK